MFRNSYQCFEPNDVVSLDNDRAEERSFSYMFSNGESLIEVTYVFSTERITIQQNHQVDSPNWGEIRTWLNYVANHARKEHGLMCETLADDYLPSLKDAHKNHQKK